MGARRPHRRHGRDRDLPRRQARRAEARRSGGPDDCHAAPRRRIDRALFGYRTTCTRGRIVVSEDVNITPEFDVAADGSFREVERFSSKFADVLVRTTVVLNGQFDTAGGASGKLSVTERYRSRKSGKSVDVCKTGTRTWSARG